MGEARQHRGWLVAAIVVAPLAVLPLRALADVWRAPALWPQEIGGRAIDVARDAGVGGALGTSMIVAVLTTTVALVIAWPAARMIATQDGGRRLVLLAIVVLPLLLPPWAVGFGLTSWLLRLGLAGSIVGLVTSHLLFVLPYVTLLLVPGFTRSALVLEEAAAVAGAGPWDRLRLVTLPALAPSVAVSAMLGFVVSWGQYGTSLAVGSGRPTLPVVLLPFVGTDPQVAAAITLVFLVPPVLALVLATRRLPTGMR